MLMFHNTKLIIFKIWTIFFLKGVFLENGGHLKTYNTERESLFFFSNERISYLLYRKRETPNFLCPLSVPKLNFPNLWQVFYGYYYQDQFSFSNRSPFCQLTFKSRVPSTVLSLMTVLYSVWAHLHCCSQMLTCTLNSLYDE